jgi:hypothetical protein
MLARRAVKGGLPLIPAAKRLMDEIMAPPAMEAGGDAPLEAERRAVAAMKKVALMVLGTAMQTYGAKLADEQEVLLAAADIIIDVYASESALLRASQAGHPASRGRRPGLCQRRRRPRRRGGEDGARRDGRRRHAAHAPRRAAPPAEGHADQHDSSSAVSWRTPRWSAGRYLF